MIEQEKIITRTVEQEKVEDTIAKLNDQGYLVTSVKDVSVGGGTRKQIIAKHKNLPIRPGLAFDD